MYQNICEWFTLDATLDLKKGNYRFVLTFVRDPAVMKQYFGEKKYAFTQEQIDGLTEMLTKNENDDFIPVSFSAVIK